MHIINLAKKAQNMACHPILSLGFLDMSPSQGHAQDISRTEPIMTAVILPMQRNQIDCLLIVE